MQVDDRHLRVLFGQLLDPQQLTDFGPRVEDEPVQHSTPNLLAVRRERVKVDFDLLAYVTLTTLATLAAGEWSNVGRRS